MTFSALQAAPLRPASVAIHYECNVWGDSLWVDVLHSAYTFNNVYSLYNVEKTNRSNKSSAALEEIGNPVFAQHPD